MQVSKWRLQFKEAEARLAEVTGDKTGDAKRLVWGVADEERFRGELDEKVRPCNTSTRSNKILDCRYMWTDTIFAAWYSTVQYSMMRLVGRGEFTANETIVVFLAAYNGRLVHGRLVSAQICRGGED